MRESVSLGVEILNQVQDDSGGAVMTGWEVLFVSPSPCWRKRMPPGRGFLSAWAENLPILRFGLYLKHGVMIPSSAGFHIR